MRGEGEGLMGVVFLLVLYALTFVGCSDDDGVFPTPRTVCAQVCDEDADGRPTMINCHEVCCDVPCCGRPVVCTEQPDYDPVPDDEGDCDEKPETHI